MKPENNNTTIVVIDDEDQIRFVLEKKLSKEGYKVISLEDAEKFIELTKDHSVHIDLVITDIKLKKMDGIELLRYINSMDDPYPVLLITGHGNLEDAIQALRYGASDFIKKPFDLSDMLASVTRVLRLKREEKVTENVGQYIVHEKKIIEIPVDTSICSIIAHILTKDLTPAGLCNRSTATNVSLALVEAIDNAMIHGNLEIPSDIIEEQGIRVFNQEIEKRVQEDAYKDRKIVIYYELEKEYVEYVIEDEGNGFDYTKLPDPRDPENFYKNSGRGLLIIRTLMDEVDWNEKGNIIRLRKYRITEKQEKHAAKASAC